MKPSTNTMTAMLRIDELREGTQVVSDSYGIQATVLSIQETGDLYAYPSGKLVYLKTTTDRMLGLCALVLEQKWSIKN